MIQSDIETHAEGSHHGWRQGLGQVAPYLLLAYREVPQASLGTAPFELLHGRSVCGPLDLVREVWEADTRSSESVISYVLLMQEKLAKMNELVKENLAQAQSYQKKWYDQNALDREFQTGYQMLVLLPTLSNKLLAQWQGPFPIVKQVGKVNYQVDMGSQRKYHPCEHVAGMASTCGC